MTYNRRFAIHKGFTILEMIIAIGLIGIAVAIVSLSFSKINSNKALEASASLSASVITEARSKTLAGENAAQHGVYVGDDGLVSFRGATYNPLDMTNSSTTLNSLIGIRNINLAGGGRSIVFQKLTGVTTQSGSFEVYLKSDPTQFKLVSINQLGIVDEN